MINALLRLADGSTVPITLRPTPDSWLELVTDVPIRHCRRGHILIESTTYFDKTGRRHCRLCHNRAVRERQQKHRAPETRQRKFRRARQQKGK